MRGVLAIVLPPTRPLKSPFWSLLCQSYAGDDRQSKVSWTDMGSLCTAMRHGSGAIGARTAGWMPAGGLRLPRPPLTSQGSASRPSPPFRPTTRGNAIRKSRARTAVSNSHPGRALPPCLGQPRVVPDPDSAHPRTCRLRAQRLHRGARAWRELIDASAKSTGSALPGVRKVC